MKFPIAAFYNTVDDEAPYKIRCANIPEAVLSDEYLLLDSYLRLNIPQYIELYGGRGYFDYVEEYYFIAIPQSSNDLIFAEASRRFSYAVSTLFRLSIMPFKLAKFVGSDLVESRYQMLSSRFGNKITIKAVEELQEMLIVDECGNFKTAFSIYSSGGWAALTVINYGNGYFTQVDNNWVFFYYEEGNNSFTPVSHINREIYSEYISGNRLCGIPDTPLVSIDLATVKCYEVNFNIPGNVQVLNLYGYCCFRIKQIFDSTLCANSNSISHKQLKILNLHNFYCSNVVVAFDDTIDPNSILSIDCCYYTRIEYSNITNKINILWLQAYDIIPQVCLEAESITSEIQYQVIEYDGTPGYMTAEVEPDELALGWRFEYIMITNFNYPKLPPASRVLITNFIGEELLLFISCTSEVIIHRASELRKLRIVCVDEANAGDEPVVQIYLCPNVSEIDMIQVAHGSYFDTSWLFEDVERNRHVSKTARFIYPLRDDEKAVLKVQIYLNSSANCRY